MFVYNLFFLLWIYFCWKFVTFSCEPVLAFILNTANFVFQNIYINYINSYYSQNKPNHNQKLGVCITHEYILYTTNYGTSKLLFTLINIYIYIYIYFRFELLKLCYHPGWRLMRAGYRMCFHTLYDEKLNTKTLWKARWLFGKTKWLFRKLEWHPGKIGI